MTDESHAAYTFLAAIKAGRAAELLDALFDGGAVAFTPEGELLIISGDQFATFYEEVTSEA